MSRVTVLCCNYYRELRNNRLLFACIKAHRVQLTLTGSVSAQPHCLPQNYGNLYYIRRFGCKQLTVYLQKRPNNYTSLQNKVFKKHQFQEKQSSSRKKCPTQTTYRIRLRTECC